MHRLQLIPVILGVLLATAAGAEDFDGSRRMDCTALKGHDCLADMNQCSRLKPEGDSQPVLSVDVAAKQVKSPFRTALLPIGNVANNRENLVLQGTDLQFAWSAMIHRTTGVMTISIADRKGAYVIFAQCALATPPAPTPTTPE